MNQTQTEKTLNRVSILIWVLIFAFGAQGVAYLIGIYNALYEISIRIPPA